MNINHIVTNEIVNIEEQSFFVTDYSCRELYFYYYFLARVERHATEEMAYLYASVISANCED